MEIGVTLRGESLSARPLVFRIMLIAAAVAGCEGGQSAAPAPALDLGDAQVTGAPLLTLLAVRSKPALADYISNQTNGYITARRLSASWVVADGDRVVHLLPDGSHTSVGQRGAGPSEFRQIATICVTRGDTIVAYDSNNSRYSVVQFPSGVLWSYSASEIGSMPAQACLADGTFIATESVYAAGERRLQIAAYDLRGKLQRVIRTTRAEDTRMAVRTPVTIAAWGSKVAIADAAADLVLIMDVKSGRADTLRFEDSRNADLNDVDPAFDVSAPVGSMSPQQDPNAHVPIFDRVSFDHAGNLWVQSYKRRRTDEDRWSLVSTEGRVLRAFGLPGREVSRGPTNPPPSVLEILGDSVVALVRDDDGFASVAIGALPPLLPRKP